MTGGTILPSPWHSFILGMHKDLGIPPTECSVEHGLCRYSVIPPPTRGPCPDVYVMLWKRRRWNSPPARLVDPSRRARAPLWNDFRSFCTHSSLALHLCITTVKEEPYFLQFWHANPLSLYRSLQCLLHHFVGR